MTVTHVGSTKQYSQSWDNIFPGKPSKGKAATAKKAAPKSKPAKPGKKPASAKAKKR